VIGGANVPVNIAAGAAACYVLSITPTAPFDPTEVAFTYQGSNTPPVPTLVAINTLLMSASTSPVPDLVALAATVTNDGIVHVPGSLGAAAFAVATSNLGIGASITVSATTGSTALPLSLSVCETNPILGTCVAPPSLTVSLFIATGATPTFGIFVTANGAIPLDAAANRVYVLFSEAGGTVRGRTSVAVTTQSGTN